MLLFDIFLHNLSHALIMFSTLWACSVHRKFIVLVSKSLPHECFNSSPWIFYNQFVTWCFHTHKVKFFSFNLPPKEHGVYWSRIISVTSCRNDCVILFKSNPPGIVPNTHKFLFSVSALGPQISHFIFPSCFKGIVSDRTMSLHLALSLQRAAGTALMHSSAARPASAQGYSLTPSTLPKLATARLQEFLIFIIPVRTTFPVCKLASAHQPSSRLRPRLHMSCFPAQLWNSQLLDTPTGCVTPDKYLYPELHFLIQVPGECIKIQSLEF